MKYYTKTNAVFLKTFIYNVLLVVITAVTFGYGSYKYFITDFNRDMLKVNDKLLAQIAREVEENVVEKVNRLSMDLIVPNYNNDLLFFFNNSVKGNHSKIYFIRDYLGNISSSYSDIVESIYVFYGASNMLISSRTGVCYFENVSSDLFYEDDLKLLGVSINENVVWVDMKSPLANLENNSFDLDCLTFVRFYPGSRSIHDNIGFIAIKINKHKLANIIRQYMPEELGSVFILDEGGNFIAGGPNEKLENENNYINRVISSKKDYEHFTIRINGAPSVISHLLLNYNGWRLVNIISEVKFYERLYSLRFILFMICIITIFTGFLIANYFAKITYKPLKMAVSKVKKLYDVPYRITRSERNEYTFLENAVMNLSIKVQDLKGVIDANLPLIKHNLILNLLSNSINSMSEYNEKLKMIGVSSNAPFYGLIIIQIPKVSMDKMSIENSQYVKYTIIEQIEKYSDGLNFIIAAELPDYKLAVLLNSHKWDNNVLENFCRQIYEYAIERFRFRLLFSINGFENDPLKLYLSYKETIGALKYAYYLPNSNILHVEKINKRENNNSIIPEEILDEFSRGLISLDINLSQESLLRLLKEVKEGLYSADHCNKRILDILYTFSNYCHIKNLSNEVCATENLYTEFYKLENVDLFYQWMLNNICVVIEHMKERSLHRAGEIVEKVKNYIRDNIGNDLSLNVLSKNVFLSPAYLSRIFKEETGINITEYINENRMNEAKELILNTDLNIEQIAKKTGYNSVNYFNNKFKETYGEPPKKYKYNRVL